MRPYTISDIDLFLGAYLTNTFFSTITTSIPQPHGGLPTL